jgi:hypothetical protein
MQRARESELQQVQKSVADKLQTTVGNMVNNYTTPLEETATFADCMYQNLTVAFHNFPVLATRLGCEPEAMLAEREAEALVGRLTPIQRQRLARRLQGGDAEGEGIA